MRNGDRELVIALRSLQRSPWYAGTAVVVIAIGLALVATILAIVDGALFKPLPYAAPDRLFVTTAGWSRLNEPLKPFASTSAAQFFEWKTALPDVPMTAFNVGTAETVGTHDSVRSARVDAAFLEVAGVRLVAGGFSPEDFQAAAPIRAAVITSTFWQQRFGRDPAALGRILQDGAGRGIRVVGILPDDFVFPFPAGALFRPEVLTPRVETVPRSQGGSLSVLVRLPVGMRSEDVAQRLTLAATAWADAHVPAARPSDTLRAQIMRGASDRIGLEPIRPALTAELAGKAWTVFGAALALMLLATLNVASLAIARVGDRWRDLAVRRALGAGFGDLVRALALENGIIVAVGALAGVALAAPLLATTLNLIGGGFMIALKPPSLDVRVLSVVAGAAAIALALITVLSARAALRAALRSTLADGSGSTGRRRGGRAVIAVQVALAFVIVTGGALVVGSLRRVWQEDPGFDTRQTGVVGFTLPAGSTAADAETFIASLGRIPGVRAAGGTVHDLLAHAFNGSEFEVPPGIKEPPPGSGFPIESVPVTHGYFEAAGLALLDGRAPTEAEFLAGDRVLVVTTTVARQYWPGQRAVGQTLKNGARDFTVIGVVPDARFMALDLAPQGEIYWPVAAGTRPTVAGLYVLVRFDNRSGGFSTFMPALKTVCPSCRVFRDGAMLDAVLADTIRPRRFSAWLFSSFALSALVIIGAGVFGLVAMTTNRRTREMGIRVAIGATRARLLRQMVGEQVVAAIAGVAAGGLLAAWLVHYLEAYLYETSVFDARAWATSIAALLLVTIAGALAPALRASRVNPVRALKEP